MSDSRELSAGLDEIRAAPAAAGTLELIVIRPKPAERELLPEAIVDLEFGLVGDCWSRLPNPDTPDGGPDPKAQVTLMGTRAAALVSGGGDHQRWAEAGDQLYVDLDLSTENLPPGTRLSIGDAVLGVTDEPHLGCGKFVRRFGVEAMKLVNSDVGRALRLRGVNTRVIEPGTVHRGDTVVRL